MLTAYDSPQGEKPYLALSTLAPSAHGHPDLPADINRYASSFPHGPSDVPIFDMKDIIRGYIPPWQRAAQLRELYLENAPWFSGAVSRAQFEDELLPFFYDEARLARANSSDPFTASAVGGGGAGVISFFLCLL